MRYVALCSYFLWPYATGGERLVVEILAGLARAGHQVHLRYAIPPGLPAHAFERFLGILQRFGLPITQHNRHRVSYRAGEVDVDAVAVTAAPPAWIGSWLDELAPDVVLVQAKDTMLLPWLAVVWRGTGFVFLQETQALQDLTTMLTAGALARVREATLSMVTSSGFLQKAATDQGFETRILYSALDLPTPGRVVSPGAPITLFGTGRDKGSDAVRALAARLPGHRFRQVMGWNDGLPVQDLQNLEYAPFLLDPSPYHQGSSMVLVPSLCPEGFGRVVHEAMAARRVPLVANSGALSETAGEEGIVLPVPKHEADIEAWERAIRSLGVGKELLARMTGCRRRAQWLTEESRQQFASLFGVPYPEA